MLGRQSEGYEFVTDILSVCGFPLMLKVTASMR